jgi:hypothetical protein
MFNRNQILTKKMGECLYIRTMENLFVGNIGKFGIRC